MRRYLFGTGIIGVVTTGVTLLKSMREQEFTWRTAIAWLSWGLSLALAIGTINEVRRVRQGVVVEHDELAPEKKLLKKLR
ncbi:hypothetical protein [Microbacterium gorillae]|uniref:hypothetical protein n=1 Tax=Microbacterium gorillae TaxID=1231063 RepID=UPI00058B8390|nr:hypothetical protein [Microbacterium gorillae]